MKFLLLISVIAWTVTSLNAKNIFDRKGNKVPADKIKSLIINGTINLDAYNPAEFEKSPTPKLSAVQMVAKGQRQFSTRYFATAKNYYDENYVVCPLSIYMILSMAAYGARTKARTELFEILGIPKNESTYVKDGYKSLLTDLSNYHDLSLSVENKFFLYPTNDGPITKYFDALKKFSVKNNNYLDSKITEFPKHQIKNQWKTMKQQSPAKNIMGLTNSDLGPIGFLESSLFFKGEWATPFTSTTERPFLDTGAFYVNISTLHVVGKFRYGELPNLDATFVELPYKLYELSMFLVLPKSDHGMTTLEMDLSLINVDDLCDKGVERKVSIYLPKLSYKNMGSIKDIIKDMGPDTMFTQQSNFTGISEKSKIFPRYFVHAAEINVDEFGTFSYTKSSQRKDVLQPTSTAPSSDDCDKDCVEFDANHPFFAFIATRGQIRTIVLMAHFMGLNSDDPNYK